MNKTKEEKTTQCLICGIKIHGPVELNLAFCSYCEDTLHSYCGNCRSVITTRKCKKCKFVSSPIGFYNRAIELAHACNRHAAAKGD